MVTKLTEPAPGFGAAMLAKERADPAIPAVTSHLSVLADLVRIARLAFSFVFEMFAKERADPAISAVTSHLSMLADLVGIA